MSTPALLPNIKGIPSVQDVTNASAPTWTGPQIPTVIGRPTPASAQSGDIASVSPNARQIVVSKPSMYTAPVAAHEATHIFQNSRNGDFQRTSQSLLPGGNPLPKDYDYGGIQGLQANPLKSIGNYNPEQQADMVGDLTRAQSQLKPNMTPAQLQQWDTTKNTLERPIRQLMAVPPPNKSLAGKADEWIAERPLGQYLDHPFTRLKGIISPPSMPAPQNVIPQAPSVALGYANPSKLVR